MFSFSSFFCLTSSLGATEKTKCYRLLVRVETANAVALPADLVLPLTVRQQTPVRVLHRRGNAIRERGIRALQVKVRERGEGQSVLQVEMETEAGLYIKEWVHGDLGRTAPSLAALLGTPCTFLSLDVYDVRLPGK